MTLIPKCPTCPFPANGGYSYKEPKTGRFFDGMMGNSETTARSVMDFKRANPHLFPEGAGDLASTVQLIYAQKWDAMPWLFIGGGDAPGTPASQPQAETTCTCGANEWEEILCKTCGGHRVTGYKCKACGKSR